MFDTHFHLNCFPRDEIENIIARASAAGVRGGLVAGVWNEDTRMNLEWAQGAVFRNLRYVRRADAGLVGHDAVPADPSDARGPTVPESPRARFDSFAADLSAGTFVAFLAHGLHPMVVPGRWLDADGTLRESSFEEDARAFIDLHDTHPDFIWAIGETGFDASQDALRPSGGPARAKADVIRAQEKGFDVCISVAARVRKPIIVHSRSAWEPTIKKIREALDRGVPHVMVHCYGGAPSELDRLSAWGVYASFGGVATWPAAKKVRASALACPPSSFMLETDAPDLPPIHPDGTRPARNHPHELPLIASRIALLRNEDAAALASISDENFLRYLGLGC